ncbi:hypothetical protein [Shimia thalassica]|uniref:hypothetical protein n=1 Tax=Shimia thalassica TaxID=1715693 RepID=UPI0026E28D01|nr:hypothetical protein [Shimia thalassica]MDO6798223.1 hypothetical protein [Shimia thalassica]MDP2520157.1 hypothetical protein [Shimia thalassica]
MLKRIGAICALAASAAQAEPPLACEGHDPEWYLTLAGPVAQFRFHKRKTDFDIPHSTVAQGRDWPRAYTLISSFDTAIVVTNETACSLGDTNWPISVHVLTQRDTTPILLTGCCTVAE